MNSHTHKNGSDMTSSESKWQIKIQLFFYRQGKTMGTFLAAANSLLTYGEDEHGDSIYVFYFSFQVPVLKRRLNIFSVRYQSLCITCWK